VRRRLTPLVVALAMLLGSTASFALAPLGVTPVARAADAYKLATKVHYVVDPDARSISVSVDVTFTNLTPDPQGAFSVLETVPLAVHDVAASVTAKDGEGDLKVSVARSKDNVNVATVTLRDPLRYNKQTTFQLSYQLPDGKDASVRVRPSVVIFPVWSFGTSSEVTVDLPAAYEVKADGDKLTAARDSGITHLTSGAIADPAHWLAVVTADRETAMTTTQQSVPLAGGTVDLQVRAWADDAAWGQKTLALLASALPRLEKAIGLRYARQGPLVVSEALPGTGSLGEAEPDVEDLRIAFDQPPFTVVHQAAHVWLDESFASDRWIREGLASHYAAVVARELKLPLPYDPVQRADANKANAFALAEWANGATADQDGWAYPAAWARIDRLAGVIGEDKLQLALQRIAAGVGAYEPVSGELPTPDGALVSAVDSQRLLDQLETVSGRALDAEFGDVFGDDAKAQLEARSQARAAYRGLQAAAGDWGTPAPVRAAMEGWNFTDATKAIAAARSWLGDRDSLLQEVERAGLSTPRQLREAYRANGGGTDARDELNAERAVVADYQAATERANGSRSVFERIGLLGGREPSELLASANGLFAAGNLRGAAEVISEARGRLEGAQLNGLLRLLSLLLLVVVAAGVALYLVRRPGGLRRRRRLTPDPGAVGDGARAPRSPAE
jgi:hypothetical protein